MNSIIEDKSFQFAVGIVKLSKHLRSTKKEYTLSKQLLRSGTSIGANAAESQQAQSKADFYFQAQHIPKGNHRNQVLAQTFKSNRLFIGNRISVYYFGLY